MQQGNVRVVLVRPQTGEDLVRFGRRSGVKEVLRAKRLRQMIFR